MPDRRVLHHAPSRASGTNVWVYILLLLVVAVAAAVVLLPGLPQPDRTAPWWVWALACAVAESVVFQVRFGREGTSVSPGEVVLAVGLVFADPVDLLTARLVGQAVGLVLRDARTPAKLLFNQTIIVVETVAALWIFDLVGGAPTAADATVWRSVLPATALAVMVGNLCVAVMMRLHRRSWRLAEQLLLPMASAVASASIGALGVVVLMADSLAGLLLLAVGAVMFFAYRTYDRLRQEVADRERQAARLAEQATLLDEAHDAIVVRDLDDRVTYLNRAAEELFGWPAAEMLGQRTRERYPQPTDFDDAMARVLSDGEWAGEVALEDRSGRPILVESRWTLVRDESGEPRSVLVIDSDVTERRQLEAQLLRAQRLESIGTLAGGMAHDLNNVLTPILMAVGMLRHGETDAQRLELMRTIADSTKRGADIVRQILSFARGVEGRREVVDLAELLRDVEQIVEDTFLKTIRVVREDPVDLWPVVGDPTQIHQVLLNLCVNARDAMPDGGTLRLRVDTVVVDEQYTALSEDATPGPYIRIHVEDDGQGMIPEVLDRVFEPFYTTKPHGQGTGLGLSVSAGIIRSHGGFVHVYSQPGEGTRFLVHLPAAAEAVAAQPRSSGSKLPTGAGQLILVVDDEQQIRTTLRHTLEAFGYAVLEAADGATAVELFGSRADEVSVVVTDMMMPGMDGAATIRAMQAIRPDVPVIAASGLQSHAAVARTAELGVSEFLAKPFSIDALLQALQHVITANTVTPPTS